MSSIFLIHTEPFHKQIIPALAKRNVDVSYICTTPTELKALEELTGGFISHCIWDAMRASPAPSLSQDGLREIPDAELLARMAGDEIQVLQMLERLNYARGRVHDLRRFYLSYLAYWQGVLRKMRPDAVVFQGIPHMGFDYTLYGLCRQLGIATLIIDSTYLPDRLVLLERCDEMPRAPEKYESRRGHDTSRNDAGSDANYYRMTDRQLNKVDPWGKSNRLKLLCRFLYHTKKLIGGLIIDLPRLFSAAPKLLSPYGLEEKTPSRIVDLWRQYQCKIVQDRMRALYESATQEAAFNRPYVYFPLHLQPEASSVPMAGWYSEQTLALDTLVHSLPDGWSVYVKEHPRQFTRSPLHFVLGRTARFYKQLLAYPRSRVRLIKSVHPSEELLAHSRCVATLTGTSGWEAVQRGIPAVVFGIPWYLHCPGVHSVDSAESCTDVLTRIDSGEIRVNLEEVSNYTDWLVNKGTFQGYFSDMFGSSLTVEENAAGYAEAIAARLAIKSFKSRRSYGLAS